MNNKWQNALGLLGSFALIFVVGLVGYFYQPDSWYESLEKPRFVIPQGYESWFWLPAYMLNAVCVWVVWLHRGQHKDVFGAIVFYLVHLVLIMQWSNIFFGLHRVDIAFYTMLLLLLFVILTNAMFWRVNRLTGVLYIPYTIAIVYLTVINFQFLLLNTR